MPQVDYSKIVIYKIQHKEKDELLYVGSTTHFRNRKVQHKKANAIVLMDEDTI